MVTIRTGFSGVSVNADAVRMALENAPKRLYHEIRSAMIDIGAEHSKRVKTRFKSWTYGKKPVPEIQLRDGALRNAVKPPQMSGSDLATLRMQLIVERPANGRPYHRIQELGGTINAPSGKALTIPLPIVLDKRGRVLNKYRIERTALPATKRRKQARQGFATRDGKPTFIFKRNGKAWVAIRRRDVYKSKGKREGVILLYELRRTVRLEPRLQFGGEWDRMKGYQQTRLNAAVDRAVLSFGEGR